MSTKTSSTRHFKLCKEVKRATGRSRGPKDDDEPLDFKKKVYRGNESARIDRNDLVGASNIDNKPFKKKYGGRSNDKSKTRTKSAYEKKFDGDKETRPIYNDRKRKRVYADQGNEEEGMFRKSVEKPTRKVFSKGRTGFKDDVGKEKCTMRGKSNEFAQPEEEKMLKGEKKSRDTWSRTNNGAKKLRLKVRIDGMEPVKTDRNSWMKKESNSRSDPRKQSENNHRGHLAESIQKSVKKKVKDKKSMGGDLTENDERPTKSKRVIRIDPRDITNKRLDDGLVTTGDSKEKKEDTAESRSAELSMNAQFRAIKPSSSILSFVEDNFLGRRRLIELRRAGYNTELSAPLDNIPLSTSSERERIEEAIFRNKLTYFAAANVSSSFPSPDLPEIAFAGRSNVGKSSLLNSLTRQWGVVRTSDKPGLTQTINFFKLGSKLCLVDLPGYGFAYAKEEVKEAWEELVKEYVSTRVGLKRVCLLIDTKWGMKPRDHELIDLMERSETKYQIVLTKTDLVFPIDVARRAMQIEESLKAKKSAVQPVMMVSSKSGAGIRSLRTVLAKIARFAKV